MYEMVLNGVNSLQSCCACVWKREKEKQREEVETKPKRQREREREREKTKRKRGSGHQIKELERSKAVKQLYQSTHKRLFKLPYKINTSNNPSLTSSHDGTKMNTSRSNNERCHHRNINDAVQIPIHLPHTTPTYLMVIQPIIK